MPSSGAEQSASPVSFFASRGLGTHHNRFLLGRHRLRHQPTAGTACPPRLRWQPIRQQHQLLYDAALPKRSAAQKLWRVVQPVRAALTEDGIDQSRLDRASGALEVCGVIYAIYCLRSRRMYVGQTMEPCFKRFMSHVRAAYRGGTELFHLAIRRFGWQNFVCFPLEVLPAVAPSRHQSRVARFRQVADAREAFWIERLHTWAPRGYNSAVRARNRPGRHRRFNPMRRHVCSDRPVARPHMQDMSKDKRWYGSRDWERRVRWLFRCYDHGTLDRVVFASYRYRVISCMLSYLKHAPQSASAAAVRAVLEALTRASRLRPVFSSRTQQERRSFIRVEWTNQMLQRIGLKSVLLLPSFLTH